MINAQDLEEKIVQTFNFIYEVEGNYYVLGRDYFRLCTSLEIEVYKGFKKALGSESEDSIINQYRRVRKYVSDCQPDDRDREQKVMEFVQRLGEKEMESLSSQVDRAVKYAQIAYR